MNVFMLEPMNHNRFLVCDVTLGHEEVIANIAHLTSETIFHDDNLVMIRALAAGRRIAFGILLSYLYGQVVVRCHGASFLPEDEDWAEKLITELRIPAIQHGEFRCYLLRRVEVYQADFAVAA